MNITREQVREGAYGRAYRQSIEDPETFWLDAAKGIDWVSEPTQALDSSNAPEYQWFPNGTLNMSYNALDRHIEAGRGDRQALIYESAVTNKSRVYTFNELRDEVARFAGVLASHGVGLGDRVVIYMPMIPEALIASLACARLGAVHSVVFGGFAAKELASRINDAKPKVIVTADGGIEPNRIVEYLPIVAEALALSDAFVDAVIVKDRPEIPGGAKDGTEWVADIVDVDWYDWDQEMAQAAPHDPVPVVATHPLYILYTSGTTGAPKGVVRDTGGYAVALSWSMRNLYNIEAGQVMWTASDVGWVVGHSYIIYGPLIAGAATLVYEGKPVGTPDAAQFWRIIEKYKVRSFFTAPTAIRAVRKEDPQGELIKKFDISSLQALFLAGERTDPDTYHWAVANVHPKVVDHWWQTETGWAITGNFIGLQSVESRAGSGGLPTPGFNVQILDDEGNPVPTLGEGNIVIKQPMPPGTLTTLWRKHKRYFRCYLKPFPGYYLTGDSGYIDREGYVYVMGRTDDVINVAGHRLSTGQMEGILAAHQAVAEAAVIGAADALKGEKPFGFVVLKHGVDTPEPVLRKELIQKVRGELGAVASFKDVVVVHGLPKTRSGKILRKNLRQLVNGEKLIVPPTIEDTAVLTQVQIAVHTYLREKEEAQQARAQAAAAEPAQEASPA
ncbi:MAG: Propionyl-CoA synthetase [Pseudoclavibacter caeni]|jgi:propionyl-CoA synthetase